MRILYLNHNVIWQGTFYRCLAYARELVGRGHQVTILTIHPSARARLHRSWRDGVEIVETPDLAWGIARTGWDPYDTLVRMLHLRRRRFDLVHAFDSRPAVILPALFVRHRQRIALVLDWADWWGRGGVISERRSFFLRHVFAPIETFFEEAFRGRADALTVISDALAERARGLGVDADRIHKLPGGVDPIRWAPRPRDEARQRLGLAADAPLLLFSGFVHYDIDLVLAVLAEVLHAFPRTLLLLTGRDSPDLRRRIDALGLSGSVVNRGTVPADEVPWYVAAADVCLLPFADKQANRGRWPNKAGDYLSMARPVVSNPVGEVGKLFAATGAALLRPPEPRAMAEAVNTLIADPASREALGERARAVALEHLDYRRLAEPLEQLYRRLTQRPGD